MNGNSSAGPASSSCSLSSILGLGVCRSRAEAAQSFAKKLQTKLWSLGPSSSNGLGSENEDCYSTWAPAAAAATVAVEARLDLSRGVVTTVPVHSPSSLIVQQSSSVMERNGKDDEPDRRQPDHIKVARWMGSEYEREAMMAAASDQNESDASSTTTNPLSDSDQYFDFGIETPLDGNSSAGEEPTLVMTDHNVSVDDHHHIVINHDDGLPTQPESGCIFGSPVLSGEESDDLETSYYESLSQSPASAGFVTNKTATPAQQLQQQQDNDSFECGASLPNDNEPVVGQVGREKTPPPDSPVVRLFSLADAHAQLGSTPPRDSGARANSQGDLEDTSGTDLARQEQQQKGGEKASPLDGVYQNGGECEANHDRSKSLAQDALVATPCENESKDDKMVVVVKPPYVQLDSIHQLFDLKSDDGVRPSEDVGRCSATDHVRPATDNGLERSASPDRYSTDSDAQLDAPESAPSSKETSVSPARDETSTTTDGDVGEECDDDNDQLYRHRVQRSTSLKTGKTPPGTPGRKKIVRFADALGLDLALVRTFLDEVPNVPPSAFSDLNGLESADSDALIFGSSPRNFASYLPVARGGSSAAFPAPRNALRSLVASFTQPGSLPNFLELVKQQKICLETACLVDEMRLRGVVRVLNLDFHKSVLIRFTTDEWATQSDQMAVYVPGSCDGLSDRFSFSLTGAQSLQPGQRLIFALCYRVGGQEIWDSNHGRNYVFQCISSSSYVPSIALHAHQQSPSNIDPFGRHDSFLPYM